MDFGSSALYQIELWSQSGVRVADISALCKNRSFTLQRNEAETLTFTIDLFEFEDYCLNKLGGTHPTTLITPYVTDVKVKRNGTYLFGAQVVDVSFDLSSADYNVVVTCSGYLNLFKDRYITKAYTATDSVAIATDMITTTQGQTNGSMGITIASGQYYAGNVHDENYQRDNIKTKLQELSTLPEGRFDFGFSWDKKFQTYAQIGAKRTDFRFIWGGPLSNVVNFSMSRSGINLYNEIYGLGSGFGADQLQSTQADNASQLNYYRREQISQFNSVTIQTTLDQRTASVLSLAKDLLELPVITITTKEIGSNSFISVGDRIPVQVQSHKMLDSVNGLYRVEQIDVSIDANDFETIKLTFDSWSVNQNE